MRYSGSCSGLERTSHESDYPGAIISVSKTLIHLAMSNPLLVNFVVKLSGDLCESNPDHFFAFAELLAARACEVSRSFTLSPELTSVQENGEQGEKRAVRDLQGKCSTVVRHLTLQNKQLCKYSVSSHRSIPWPLRRVWSCFSQFFGRCAFLFLTSLILAGQVS